jgi:hypothetical protein
MKTIVLLLAFSQLVFLVTGCEKQDPEPQSYIGHFELKVTYITTTNTGQYPYEGSKMYLFSDQAKCPDFYEAMQGYARIDGKTVTSRYRARADENGEIFMYNIEARSYYMVVVSSFHKSQRGCTLRYTPYRFRFGISWRFSLPGFPGYQKPELLILSGSRK